MAQRANIQPMQDTQSKTPPQKESEPSEASCLNPEKAAEVAKSSIVELFEAHESALIRFAYSILKRREVAEEIVQEGFLKLHQHWAEVENPQAWIYRAIRNLAYNHLRKYKRELEEVDEKVVAITDVAPEQSLERMEAIGTMRLLLAELNEDERQIIHLKYTEEASYAKIAEQTGLTSSNVGYKLHHLLKRLGESLRTIGVESSKG